MLATFVLVGGLGTFIIWSVAKPTYEVVGAIRVAPILPIVASGGQEPHEIANYESFKYTQARLVFSNLVVQRVADDLADKKLSFFEDYGAGLRVRPEHRPNSATPFYEPQSILKQAIIDGAIKASAIPKTELIKVTMKSTNPQEAKQIVNSFIMNYMALGVSRSTQDRPKILTILENERKALAGKLLKQRETIQQLAQEDGTVTVDKQQKIQNLKAQLDMVKNMYDAVCRRIREVEMETKPPAMVSIAYTANVASVQDRRSKLTIVVMFGALVVSMLVGIARGPMSRARAGPQCQDLTD
jgi:uncharacterized protein involved in exopolysaccharide biosynthesis